MQAGLDLKTSHLFNFGIFPLQAHLGAEFCPCQRYLRQRQSAIDGSSFRTPVMIPNSGRKLRFSGKNSSFEASKETASRILQVVACKHSVLDTLDVLAWWLRVLSNARKEHSFAVETHRWRVPAVRLPLFIVVMHFPCAKCTHDPS